MIEVTLILQSSVPLEWTCEAIDVDGEGGIERTSFSGGDPEKRARYYAAVRYGVKNPEVMAA